MSETVCVEVIFPAILALRVFVEFFFALDFRLFQN
jgi:hypothetical protein